VLQRALAEAGIGWEGVDGIAVTNGPGLAGSLLVGVNMAKGTSYALALPLVGVNHLEGHLYANWLDSEEPQFPLLALIVSGGHSDLILVKGHGKYTLLGKTRDDAAGEAFDKVARILGLSYPGGPAIQKTAADGDATKLRLPRAWLGRTYDFSFSGLKTAVLRLAEQREEALQRSAAQNAKLTCRLPGNQTINLLDLTVADIAASFQEAVVDVLVEKTRRAATAHRVKMVLLAGGVAANRKLREEMTHRLSIPVRYPAPILCTDNAAMVAAAGYFHLHTGERAGLDLDVVPNMSLT
jgi:N6-L-threonylcarbamoyladenine synthase